MLAKKCMASEVPVDAVLHRETPSLRPDWAQRRAGWGSTGEGAARAEDGKSDGRKHSGGGAECAGQARLRAKVRYRAEEGREGVGRVRTRRPGDPNRAERHETETFNMDRFTHATSSPTNMEKRAVGIRKEASLRMLGE